MRHLELIMSDSNKSLTADDARALFSDALEGSLDKDVQKQLDALLATDPALRAEQQAFAQTVSLLKALPSADAPENLVGKVRDRLAAERRQAGAKKAQEECEDAAFAPSASTARRFFAVEWVAGLAAAAAVAAVVVVGVPSLTGKGGNDGVVAAGASDSAAIALSWRAPGLSAADVAEAAKASGLSVSANGSFVGDRDGAGRFLVLLKTKAATAGGEVSGQVPESADQVVITVTP